MVRQSTVFTQSVGMVALCDKYHFRVVFQSGNYFIVQSHIGDKQKFQWCAASADKRQLFAFKCRPCAGLSFPKVGIDNVLYAFGGRFGQLTAHVYIVGHKLRIEIHIAVQACGNDNGKVFSAYIAHGCRGSAFRRQILEFGSYSTRYVRVVTALYNIVRQFPGNRNFCFGSFT